MPEVAPKTIFHADEKNKSIVHRTSATTSKISSSVSFHQYFQVFHTKFNIRFRRLVLPEMIFKKVVQKLAIRCKLSWN